MKVSQLSNLIQAIACRLGRNGHVSNESELSDSSYEEASFDAQMRSFFRAEYGKAGPPDDISVHLIQAIRLYHEKQSRRASAGFTGTLVQMVRKLAHMPGAIYRFGSRPDTSRLLSGSALAALLVMAMAPKMVQSLSGRGVDMLYGSQETNAGQVWSDTFKEKVANRSVIDEMSDTIPAPAISRGLDAEQTRLKIELMTGEDFDAPAQIIEDAGLHPVERGMGPKKTSPPLTLMPQDTRNHPPTIQW